MALDTATAKTEPGARPDGISGNALPRLFARPLDDMPRLSPLLLRILAVNVLALAILVGSLLYLGRYQERLIAAGLDALMLQARLTASALGEGSVVVDRGEQNIMSPLLARLMIRRLVEGTDVRTRLFDTDDTLLADSRILSGRIGRVQVEELPPLEPHSWWLTDMAMKGFDMIDSMVEKRGFPPYTEGAIQHGSQYDIVSKAMAGMSATEVWSMSHGGLMLAVAVPVQRYRQVLGVVMVSRPDTTIDAAVRDVRLDILRMFGGALLITVLLSLYLARTIAKPLRQLAEAADTVRLSQRQDAGLGVAGLLKSNIIPDLSARRDEIGELSLALRAMTEALARRVSAIENFAADVAHEIKNPLTSLRSAIETVERVRNPDHQQKLMHVLRDDVDRLDRLISDISSASRLDAELGRAEAVEVDVKRMLQTLTGYYTTIDTMDEDAIADSAPEAPRVVLDPLPDTPLMTLGAEGRLAQVVQNLISNALSFSPAGGIVRIAATKANGAIIVTIDDDGPGIPDNKLDAIFERFYSERPKAEKFGTHSGLGLSISRQIIEAHGGAIRAENRRDNQERVIGARFIMQLQDATRDKPKTSILTARSSAD